MFIRGSNFIAELRRTRRGWIVPVITLLTAGALQFTASRFPHFIEQFYSRQLYPFIARILSVLNSPFSFAIAEPLLWAFIVLALLLCLRSVRKVIRQPLLILSTLISAIQKTMLLTGIAALAFLLIWGLNYQRLPVTTQVNLSERTPSVDELEALTRFVVERTRENYEASAQSLTETQRSEWKTHSTLPFARERLGELIEAAYQQESAIPEKLQHLSGRPKPALISALMSRLRISGIFIPFTGEPLFNSGQPDSELPFSLAHEKAHQRGYAREDEASFIAFLVCTRSGDPYVRYVGYLEALSIAARWRTLLLTEAQTPEKRSEAMTRYRDVIARLGDGPRADLQYAAQYWRQYQGALSRVSHTVNDSYLKANRVPGGVMSYNDVYGLIIRYYLQHPELMKQNEAAKESKESGAN